MQTELKLLHTRSEKISQHVREKYINNRIPNDNEKKIVKMLEHFNDRLKKLEQMYKDATLNVFVCKFILSDLNEMIKEIEKFTEIQNAKV